MKYLVLARKYRPQNFAELVGQDALVQTISNSFKFNKLHHAYLLTGIRGIGKTTTARLIAKLLNCENPITNDNISLSCGICSSCIDITNASHPDVLEFDAASRTGVDDMRNLMENIQYRPMRGRYKIYIIDEVHMLSTAAFNSLLKTLEEPPERIVFIFATTEIRKIPLTIISRTQRFDLKRLDTEALTGHLQNILAQEKIEMSNEVVNLISSLSSGSVRDALSLLDRVISYSVASENKIDVDYVRFSLGLVGNKEKISLLKAILTSDAKRALNIVKELSHSSNDYKQLMADLLDLFTMIAKAKVYDIESEYPEFNSDDIARIKALATNQEMGKVTLLWKLLSNAEGDLLKNECKLSAFEMIVIRLCYASHLPTIYRQEQEQISPPKHIEEITLPQVLELLKEKGELILHNEVYSKWKVNSLKGNVLELAEEVSEEQMKKLLHLVKENYKVILKVVIKENIENKTLKDLRKEEEAAKLDEYKNSELVKEIFELFPKSELVVK